MRTRASTHWSRAAALRLSPLLLLAAAACTPPVYAPPARAAQYGAPGRVHAGEVEVGGTMLGVFTPTGGSAHVAVGLRDWVSVEGGGTFVHAPAGPDPVPWMTMGWAGARFTVPRSRGPSSLLFDGELGVSGGVGGSSCMTGTHGTVCDTDGHTWSNRAAFGGYEGLGLGGSYKWFSLYVRARVEESIAQGTPVTYWPSLSMGLGFDIVPRVSLDLLGGYLAYYDSKDSEAGWFYQSGLTVRFGR